MRTRAMVLAFCVGCSGVLFPSTGLAEARESEGQKRNYIGVTPTLALIGMYGIAYARALNENLILAMVGGYTNFDWSPLPFLRNERWIYQSVYGGINISCFPFSRSVFPAGFFVGVDLVPALGFAANRVTRERGVGVGLSFDALTGYSWILLDTLKISIDVFLNVNTPGLHLAGVDWNESDRWSILPFFDLNIGIVF